MLVLDGELPEQPAPEPEVDHGTCRCGGKFDADGWCTECGERRPDPRHHFSAQPSPWLAAVCDRGIRHQDNEDAMAVWADETDPGRSALVVCDGVTTATRSAEASMAAAFAALDALVEGEEDQHTRMVAAASAAADAVAAVGEEFPDSAPSCTFVAAVVEDGRATIGSVGDSRAYWFPEAASPVRLTRDDSMAEEQIDAGTDRATAEAGPLGHTITRWLGPDSLDHDPHPQQLDVSSPGWLLLCSDGLWNYASEPADLYAVLREQERAVGRSPADLAQALVDWANSRGGADNITVALLRTGETAYPQDPQERTAGEAQDQPRQESADGAGEDVTHG